MWKYESENVALRFLFWFECFFNSVMFLLLSLSLVPWIFVGRWKNEITHAEGAWIGFSNALMAFVYFSQATDTRSFLTGIFFSLFGWFHPIRTIKMKNWVSANRVRVKNEKEITNQNWLHERRSSLFLSFCVSFYSFWIVLFDFGFFILCI